MSEKILVCVAWPYASGDRHLGHVAGAYLPPDIFARYQRLRGRDALMVSGSDTHGTPITVRAEQAHSSISPSLPREYNRSGGGKIVTIPVRVSDESFYSGKEVMR